MKIEIEKAIKETLVVENELGIKYCVDKIDKLINQRIVKELEKHRDRWKSQMDAIPNMIDVRQGRVENVTDIKRYQMEGLAQAWYELRERIKELKQ